MKRLRVKSQRKIVGRVDEKEPMADCVKEGDGKGYEGSGDSECSSEESHSKGAKTSDYESEMTTVRCERADLENNTQKKEKKAFESFPSSSSLSSLNDRPRRRRNSSSILESEGDDPPPKCDVDDDDTGVGLGSRILKKTIAKLDRQRNQMELAADSSFDFQIPLLSRQSSAKVFPEIDYEPADVRKNKIRDKLKISLRAARVLFLISAPEDGASNNAGDEDSAAIAAGGEGAGEGKAENWESVVAAAGRRRRKLAEAQAQGSTAADLPDFEEVVVESAAIKYEEGRAFARKGEYEAAIRSFQKAIILKPRIVEFHRHLAICFLQICDFKSAIDVHRRILELDPADTDAENKIAFLHYYIAQILFEQRRILDALENYGKAAELKPENVAYQAGIVVCLGALGRRKESLSLLNRCLTFDRKNADLYIMRARLNNLANAWRASYYDVREAILLNPDHAAALPMAHSLKSRSAALAVAALESHQRKRHQGAIAKISRAIETDPSSALFRIVRGSIYRHQLMYREAVDDFLIALELSHTGMSRESAVMYEKAEEQLVMSYNDFAIESYMKGAYELAVTYLNKALAVRKDSAFLYLNRGDCWLRMGHLDSALADYRLALEMKPDQAGAVRARMAIVHNMTGVTLYRKEYLREATRHFTKAVEYEPRIGRFYLNLAETRSRFDKSEARYDALKAATVLGAGHRSLEPLHAKLFPGKAKEQIELLAKMSGAAAEVNQASLIDEISKSNITLWNNTTPLPDIRPALSKPDYAAAADASHFLPHEGDSNIGFEPDVSATNDLTPAELCHVTNRLVNRSMKLRRGKLSVVEGWERRRFARILTPQIVTPQNEERKGIEIDNEKAKAVDNLNEENEKKKMQGSMRLRMIAKAISLTMANKLTSETARGFPRGSNPDSEDANAMKQKVEAELLETKINKEKPRNYSFKKH